MSTAQDTPKRARGVRIVHDDKRYTWSTTAKKKIADIIAHYPEGKQASAVIPLLKLAQEEFDGWLPVGLMDLVAETLDMPPVRVYEVASFYDMLHTEPVGKHIMRVCTNVSCLIRGADKIMATLEKELAIKKGQTSKDGLITVQEFECLGACCEAPMMMLDNHYETNLTEDKVREIIGDLKAGKIRHALHGIEAAKEKAPSQKTAAVKETPAKKASAKKAAPKKNTAKKKTTTKKKGS